MIKRGLFAAVLFVAAIAAVAWFSLHDSYRGFDGETFLTVQHGSGGIKIGRELAQAGVVRFAWQFWLARLLNPTAKLQAGEYRFHEAANPGEVLGRIARGDVYYFEFTVTEGSNMFDIAHLLESASGIPAEEFLRAAADPALIQDLAPAAKSLEGFLFPATYRLTHSTSAHDLSKQMVEQFRRQWKKLDAGKNANVLEAVTLASLVEKETGIASERPLVAGVFANRLRIDMPLQCDPTVVYAALLDNRYRNAIHKSDLASQNPYNTYQHAGLPPGPIANPGAESIAAALSPAETNYLYFVANANGVGHRFSQSLAEHDKATREYRKKARKAG